ncbi:hypothetical protein [Amycolatopsis regifaucium]|uniref:Uncharacterized protein n=1 Tax=Amycolatopsis regifaucium TaxID=546365 RepID=A0A154MJ08_9PSEU|nr:hypothetical protein [Amycolatopsis regifaucium]KZB84322.1 hypothetical protein AVL48_33605 [Amycolatopsis regifaucium]OKA03287.1 hypothetical protein ATP06_0236890 [Amycolatopsis regifaucium]SFJ69186.1 hypothetical protein SAMN04489731_1317 [Amycolatopsis regifaucium]
MSEVVGEDVRADRTKGMAVEQGTRIGSVQGRSQPMWARLLPAALPYVLYRAAADAAAWAALGGAIPAVLLGLPGSTVHDEPLLDNLTCIAVDTAMQPGQLQFAVPAHALTGQPAVLRRLRELPFGHTGIRLALTNVLLEWS